MATCVIEDAALTPLYCPTMKQAQSPSFEAINELCPFNFQVNTIQMDSRNQELTKKRHLSRSNTYSYWEESTRVVTDNSWQTQAVSTNTNNNESTIRTFIYTESLI